MSICSLHYLLLFSMERNLYLWKGNFFANQFFSPFSLFLFLSVSLIFLQPPGYLTPAVMKSKRCECLSVITKFGESRGKRCERDFFAKCQSTNFLHLSLSSLSTFRRFLTSNFPSFPHFQLQNIMVVIHPYPAMHQLLE